MKLDADGLQPPIAAQCGSCELVHLLQIDPKEVSKPETANPQPLGTRSCHWTLRRSLSVAHSMPRTIRKITKMIVEAFLY